MAYTITDYLRRCRLRTKDKVDFSLTAQSKPASQRLGTLGTYEISLLATVNQENERTHRFPLARVLQADRPDTFYGSKNQLVTGLVGLLQAQGITEPAGMVLAPFSTSPLIELERRMSSNSIVYVFSGLIEYAQAVHQRIQDDKGGAALFANEHHLNTLLLDEAHRLVQGTFQGYQIKTERDLQGFRHVQSISSR